MPYEPRGDPWRRPPITRGWVRWSKGRRYLVAIPMVSPWGGFALSGRTLQTPRQLGGGAVDALR